jgi:LPS-assembly protein
MARPRFRPRTAAVILLALGAPAALAADGADTAPNQNNTAPNQNPFGGDEYRNPSQTQPTERAPQQSQTVTTPHSATLSKNAPVTFLADRIDYDRTRGFVVATGHVEAWQTGQQLRADTVTYDRATGVMAASGHVQMIQADGEVLFSDYAELTSDMKTGILRHMRALLAANGRLAANGARRSPGPINIMSKAIYSTCNLCVKHPTRAPLWDLRARTIVQDVPHKRIEYYHAWLDMEGIPLLYLPYFSNADPSVRRASGFLVPSIGTSTYLGAFGQLPYYWVIGPSSDATIIPLIGTEGAQQVETIYRRSFNNGTLRADASVADYQGTPAGHLFANAQFNYNDTWRYGFAINVASSVDYLRDFQIGSYLGNVLNSQLYAEGFGEGAYSRVSALSYQGLNSTVTNSQLPFVLPRYQYDYFGQPDIFGGRISLSSDDFNIVRRQGTNDQRLNLNGQWERTGIGDLGDVWSLTGRVETVAYNAFDLNQEPNYAPVNATSTGRALPTAALKMSWPLVRAGRDGSSLLVEPIVQLIAAPNTGSSTYAEVPNEDALSPEFSDATLFSLNRFQGSDRQEGGLRANYGLHVTWNTKAGLFDGLVGESYRLHSDDTFPAYVGLGRHASDIVGRVTYTPSPWFDLTTRGRFDRSNFNLHYGEAVGSAGPSWLRLSAGYLYTPNTPYFLDFEPPQGDPNQPRNEIQFAASTHYGRWRASGYGTRDLQLGQMVATGADGAYEDECFIFDLKFTRRYTSINNDHGSSTVLFQITLKTVGAFGFHAM